MSGSCEPEDPDEVEVAEEDWAPYPECPGDPIGPDFGWLDSGTGPGYSWRVPAQREPITRWEL